jgi:hypothetical protein
VPRVRLWGNGAHLGGVTNLNQHPLDALDPSYEMRHGLRSSLTIAEVLSYWVHI